MNERFQKLMQEATRLTQAGDLAASVAAIQTALGAKAAPVRERNGGDVIDVEARVVSTATKATTDKVATPSPTESFSSGSFRNKAGSRDYKLFVAPEQAGKPRALLLMLHGCTQDPDDFAAGTRMNELAAAHNMLVLYPAQAQQANPQRCWNWFKHSHQGRDRGEPSILAGMTREIIARYGVDPGHVFVAGLSAGGAMAAILGQSFPELFTAVGIHSGLVAGAAKDLPSAMSAMASGSNGASSSGALSVPTIVFHGDGDATVNPRNGAQIASSLGGEAAVEEQLLNRGGLRCTRQIHRTANGRTTVENWLVHGAGHAWFGGSPAGSYTDPKGPNASEEMLRFFLESRRRDQAS